MRICMFQLNHLLRYMGKRLRYRWSWLHNIWRQSPSNLRYILDFHKSWSKRRVIIQRNLRGFLFLRIWRIQQRQQLRKPNKIHIVLNLWRLGRHLWWPNWRKRKQRFHRWFRLGFLTIRGRWLRIHHWSYRWIYWFLWCRFGWNRHCVWQLLIRWSNRWPFWKHLLEHHMIFRGQICMIPRLMCCWCSWSWWRP